MKKNNNILESFQDKTRIQLKVQVTPHLLAISVYFILTLIIAWRIITNLNLGTAGHFEPDQKQFIWNFWWFRYSLFEAHTDLFHTNFLFHPYGASLYLHTLSLYNLLVGFPLQLLFGIVPTFNLLQLMTFPLTGYSTFLLVRYLIGEKPGRDWGAFLAGIIWSFGSYHFVMLDREWLNLSSMQWVPLCILFLLKLNHSRFFPTGIFLAFFFLLTLLTDYYYVTFLIIFTGLFWLWQIGNIVLETKKQKLSWVKAFPRAKTLTLKIIGAYLIALVAYSPVLIPSILEITSGKYDKYTFTEPSNTHSTNLLQMFLPPAHNPWIGQEFDFWKSIGIGQLNTMGANFGIVVLILGIYALLKTKGQWFWGLSAIFWILPSFGPQLRINDISVSLPMPYNFIKNVPIFTFIRFPERYLVMAQLSLAILAAFGLVSLVQKIKYSAVPVTAMQAGITALLVILCLFESLPGILPTPAPLGKPAFTDVIAAKNASSEVAPDKAILELPVTKHGTNDAPRMFYQTYHERPIVGGYTSREPPDPYRFSDYELYNFVQLELPPEGDVIPALRPRDLLGLLNNANIGYLVLYPQDFKGGVGTYQKAIDLVSFTAGGSKTAQPLPFYQDNLAVVYKVPQVTLTEPLLVMGRGWEVPETIDKNKNLYQRWLQSSSQDARIVIVASQEVDINKEYSLNITVATPDRPRHLQLYFNELIISDRQVDGLTSFQVSNIKLRKGNNVLIFKPDPADGYFQPSMSGSRDNRKLQISLINLSLNVMN